MRVFVVRHVKAGQRDRWDGPDVERPMSKTGAKQAAAIAERLHDQGVTRLVASPFVRCRQSLEALGDLVGLPVESDDRLAEGASITDTLELVDVAPDGTVLCSHGDVIPELIGALTRRGMTLTNDPDWRKATLWTLEREGGPSLNGDGPQFDRATVEPPPNKS